MSQPFIEHVWLPVPVRDRQWHHYIITRVKFQESLPTGYGENIRIAYELTDKDGGHISNVVDLSADETARWNLSPDVVSQWVAQRAHGWDGTLASIVKVVILTDSPDKAPRTCRFCGCSVGFGHTMCGPCSDVP